MTEKTKEEMSERLKQKWLRNFGRDRPLPSEEFVQEASGRWIMKDSSSSERSVSEDLGVDETEILPEKQKKKPFQICDYCRHKVSCGEYSLILHYKTCEAHLSWISEESEKAQKREKEEAWKGYAITGVEFEEENEEREEE